MREPISYLLIDLIGVFRRLFERISRAAESDLTTTLPACAFAAAIRFILSITFGFVR